jgi:ATP adenylyltransferase
MDRLWTPWRFAYVSNIDREDPGCVFCRILGENHDHENLVLYRGPRAFIVLNLYPYTSGHLLIVAGRHIAFLNDAAPEELHAFLELAQVCEHALRSEYQPDGFNMGFNLGRAAGAGVDRHLHMHVLPRWAGDSNFVSVVSETRVIPEALPQTFHRLAPYFEGLTL